MEKRNKSKAKKDWSRRVRWWGWGGYSESQEGTTVGFLPLSVAGLQGKSERLFVPRGWMVESDIYLEPAHVRTPST